MVRVAISDDRRSWETTDPSLTTCEVRDLIAWCRSLADEVSILSRGFEATEPNVSFNADGRSEATRLTAILTMESCPPWVEDAAESPRHATDYPAAMLTFAPGRDGLRAFADELEQELARYPERP
jgi:hypothetical protein